MKIFLILVFLFASLQISEAQVTVSPYVVMIDNNNKFGTYLVVNMTEEEQEISISFKFGYPATGENGNTKMIYEDEPSKESNSITEYIKVFPSRFMLKPGEKQTVRMTVNPPSDLKTGTYWTRIITSSQKKQEFDETVTNLSTKINFVLNQITTVIYKNQHYKSRLDFDELRYEIDSNSVNLITSLKSIEDQPYFAHVTYKVYDTGNNLITEGVEFVSVYYDMMKMFSIPLSSLSSGTYSAKVTITGDESPDIPRSDNFSTEPIEKSVMINIP